LTGRYQIDTAGIERMTTADPPGGEPNAAPKTVFTHGLDGINGAAGIKTAMSTQPDTKSDLIKPDQTHPD